MREPLALALYRSVTRLGEPAGWLLLRWRKRRRKEDPKRWPERLGHAAQLRPAGHLVWLHGASVGEGLALLPLINGLVARRFEVLVTTGTVTSSRVLGPRLPAGATHQFVPLDFPGAVRRFFDHWRPDVAGFAESELWPNLLAEARRRGIPTVLVNARMSPRSFRRWRRLAGPIRALLGGFDLVLAQSEDDAARYSELGASPVLSTGNVKFDVPPPGAEPLALAALREAIGLRPVWLAASTHAGEDELCCAIHGHLAPARPGLLTMVVPRKAERGAAIAAQARALGLTVRMRSQGELPAGDTDLYVADTMGELGLFFRVAPLVFVGKSLGPNGGGQNPIEPAKLGCAILHGPAVANFRDIYEAFDRAGASLAVADPAALERAVGRLLDNPAAVPEMARKAAAVVAENLGSTARTVEALEPILAAVLQRPGP